MGVAPEGAQLIASSLSAEVVETILQSRAPSTRKLYALKWRLFTSWCGDCQLDPLEGRGHPGAPPAGVVEAVGVAPEGAQLIASSLSAEVVETILQSRAPSTRKLYALKWRLFTSWCGDCQLDPVNCPVGTVLEFVQARLSAGLTHSTLKVYVAAISAYHASLGGQSVGRHLLVTRFLRGALRLRPPVRSCIPPWDLAVV